MFHFTLYDYYLICVYWLYIEVDRRHVCFDYGGYIVIV